jgi:single-strand DNA-binding protein
MPDGLNKVMLLGNLGADAEVRVTQGGETMLTMRIATTDTWYDASNTKQERTEWHRVTVFGARAQPLVKAHLTKGDRVFVEGRLETRSYDKGGEKRYSTEVIAQSVILLGGRDRERGREKRGKRDVDDERRELPFSRRLDLQREEVSDDEREDDERELPF